MQDFTFSRDKRLLNSREYQAVFDKNEVRLSHSGLLLLARENKLGYARVGIIVSKKNCRRAVGRNRIKRVVRDTFRLAQSDLDSLDIIFLARTGIVGLKPEDQTSLLQSSWKKLQRKAATRKR